MMPRFVAWWAEVLALSGRAAAGVALAAADSTAGLDGAAARFTEAVALSRALGMRSLEARCRLELGLALSALAESVAAREHLAAAAKQLRWLDMTRWVTQAEGALAAP
jgi:hypothetical protein